MECPEFFSERLTAGWRQLAEIIAPHWKRQKPKYNEQLNVPKPGAFWCIWSKVLNIFDIYANYT